MALVIVAMLLYLIHMTKLTKEIAQEYRVDIVPLTVITLFLTLVQIVLGTQVRQMVDHQIDLWVNLPKICGWQKLTGSFTYTAHFRFSF